MTGNVGEDLLYFYRLNPALFNLVGLVLASGIAVVAIIGLLLRRHESLKLKRAFEQSERQRAKIIDWRNNTGNRLYNKCVEAAKSDPRVEVEKWIDKNDFGLGPYRIAVFVRDETSLASAGFGKKRGFDLLEITVWHPGKNPIELLTGPYGEKKKFSGDEEGILDATIEATTHLRVKIAAWPKSQSKSVA